jgi:hypothetical protein
VSSGRTQSIEIARAPEAVFAYMTDPAKPATWQDAEEVVQLTPGPLGATGARQRFVVLATLAVFRRFHRRLKRALERG